MKKTEYAQARDEFLEFYKNKLAPLLDADSTRKISVTYKERMMFESLFEYMKTMREAVRRGGRRGRKPDSEVSAKALYMRERRAKLRG